MHLERNKLQLEWTWQQHVPERNILCIIIIFLCNKMLRHKKNSQDKGICLQMKLTIIIIIIITIIIIIIIVIIIVITWLRTLISFELLRSVHACVRGSRTPFRSKIEQSLDCKINVASADI